MSAPQRFWPSTSSDYQNVHPSYLSQHPSPSSINPAGTPSALRPAPPPRRPSAPQFAHHHVGRAPSAATPQPSAPSPVSAPSLAPTPQPAHVNNIPSLTHSPALVPSSIPSTPVLLAKELPVLAAPVPNINTSSAADIMYNRYRHHHSRSSSFSNSPAPASISMMPSVSATNNSTSTPSSISRLHNPYTPSHFGLGIITSSPSPTSSSLAPSSAVVPSTPSRRLSSTSFPSPLSLTTSGLGVGFHNAPISTPMTPSSSLGLGSPPNFSPHPLPNVLPPLLSSPSRPARSPARPQMGPLSQLSQSITQTPSQYSVPPTPSRLAHVLPSSLGQAPSSRRNSRQVSVRLSSAFVQPPTRSGSVSGSVSRSTTRGVLFGTSVSGMSRISQNSARQALGLDMGEEDESENEDEDVVIFRNGDVIGEGCTVSGEVVRAVSPSPATPGPTSASPKAKFEVIRKLGTGSYGFVYLVREVLPSSASASSKPKARDVFDDESDDLFSFGLGLETGISMNREKTRYGKEFAIKVLSKKNLDEDELAIQMTEVTIHQSLQSHPNIVTLHRALETDSLLILVLEYVPGEDLYYFLEQQRDRRLSLISGVGTGSETTTKVGSGSDEYEDVGDDTLVDQNEDAEDEDEDARGRRRSRALHNLRHPRVPTSASTSSSAKSDVDSPSTSDDEREQGQEVSGKGAGAGTPPTPSLLSSVHPQTMLSFGRLKLIASMFGQMCDAVQACHAQGISHRDIKPENFIVTSAKTAGAKTTTLSQERKVIVKLSDFGLATTEKYSADVDCGSAPYMSYECRNVVGPTYATQPADVWSLGIVLINMLYHHNLWHDTCDGDASFEAFRAQPVAFLMQRSPGMTRDVAEFLAERVFRVLPTVPSDLVVEDYESGASAEEWAKYEEEVLAARVSAGEFGEWARNLPALFNAGTIPLTGAGVGTGAGPLAANGLPNSAVSVPPSRRGSIEAGVVGSSGRLAHSPGCAYNQLQQDGEEYEDEDEDEEVIEEKTFTMADLRFDEDEEDRLVMSSSASTIMLNHSSPSQSSQSSVSPILPVTAPHSPRSLRPSTPLHSEPMPLALPIGSPFKIVSEDHDPTCAQGPEVCMACLNDEEYALGLAGAMSPIDGDDFPRTTSALKRRKRGARKNRGANSSVPPSVVSSPRPNLTSLPSGLSAQLQDVSLDHLAQDTQFLAREISQTTRRASSRSRSRARIPHHAPPPPSLPSVTPNVPTLPLDIEIASPAPATHVPVKKPSKWNMFSRKVERDTPEPVVPLPDRTASFINDLVSTYPPSVRSTPSIKSKSPSSSPYSSFDSTQSSTYSQTTSSSSIAFSPPPIPNLSNVTSDASWRGRQQSPGRAPPSLYSVRSGLQDRYDRSPASSTYSSRSNATTVQSWRTHQTPSSAASSVYHNSVPSSSASSTFTRFRNGSEASFSTIATTAPASSVFNVGGTAGVLAQKKGQAPPPAVAAPAPAPVHSKPAPRRPANVKQIDGVPWALDELPRQMRPLVNGQMPKGDIFGAPPQRNRGRPAPPKPALDTITERPKTARPSINHNASSSASQRTLQRPTSPGAESIESEGSDPHKKVQKAQINSLAKLHTSFKTNRKAE